MTDEGFFGLEGRALGLLGLADEAAHFGVGVAPIGAAPREAGAGAVWNRLVSGGQEGRRVGRSARDP